MCHLIDKYAYNHQTFRIELSKTYRVGGVPIEATKKIRRFKRDEIMSNTEQNTLHTQKIFLTTEEAAEYLGIAKITLYTYTSKRVIPFYKTRRKIYFKIEDLENYVLNSENRVKSAEEIDQEASRYDSARKS